MEDTLQFALDVVQAFLPAVLGVPCLRRQARGRQRSFVRTSDDSSLSSLHFETLSASHAHPFCSHPPLFGRAHGVDVMNSCGVMHDARVNSFGLHSARVNSGGHINSYRCTYNSCGGVRGGTKPRSMITRGQFGCLVVEKLASLQQAPGRLHVETQLVDFPGGGNLAGVC